MLHSEEEKSRGSLGASWKDSHSEGGESHGAEHVDGLAEHSLGAAKATAAAVAVATRGRKPCSACLERSDDTPEERRIKRVAAPVYFVVTALIGISVIRDVTSMGREESGAFYIIARSFGVLAGLLFFAGGLAGCSIGWVVDATMVMFAIVNIVVDLRNKAVLQMSLLGLVIILLDMSILFKRRRVPPIIIPLTVCYLLVDRYEATFRTGLYDLVGEAAVVCDCASPPCARRLLESFTLVSFFLFILGFDFFLTRRFADDVQKQLRRLESAASVSEEVTAALARYDVSAAREALDTESAEAIPTRMRKAFEALLGNLHQFKAAMPIDVLTKKNRAVINTEE
eukprot:Hpha_TRINITY_DN16308_c2_g6::TRINITY_DN16308_c2_g6_i1::g.58752::m.58752